MQVFLVFSHQKSGTTYLQQLLDAHPEINCPPEHLLRLFENNLRTLLKKYRPFIQEVDERTARQGLRYDEDHVFRHTMRGLISGLVTDGAAPETTHFGLSDNLAWQELPLYAEIFPNARFVGIVRDPRAIALSLYHHRLRTEPEEAKKSEFRLYGVTKVVSEDWGSCMAKYEAFAATPGFASRFHLARYEDLVDAGKKVSTLSDVFSFLGLNTNTELVEKILADHDFSARRAESGGFLRAGPTEAWRTELSADDIAAIEAAAGRFLAMHGYQPFEPQ